MIDKEKNPVDPRMEEMLKGALPSIRRRALREGSARLAGRATRLVVLCVALWVLFTVWTWYSLLAAAVIAVDAAETLASLAKGANRLRQEILVMNLMIRDSAGVTVEELSDAPDGYTAFAMSGDSVVPLSDALYAAKKNPNPNKP